MKQLHSNRIRHLGRRHVCLKAKCRNAPHIDAGATNALHNQAAKALQQQRVGSWEDVGNESEHNNEMMLRSYQSYQVPPPRPHQQHQYNHIITISITTIISLYLYHYHYHNHRRHHHYASIFASCIPFRGPRPGGPCRRRLHEVGDGDLQGSGRLRALQGSASFLRATAEPSKPNTS